MNPVEQIALAKYVADKGTREKVSPGRYKGHLHVDTEYDIRVGEDYDQQIVGKVPWMKIAAVLLSKVNDATIESVLREVLAGDIDDAEIKAQAEAAMAELCETTEKTCKGKVTGATIVTNIRSSGGLV